MSLAAVNHSPFFPSEYRDFEVRPSEYTYSKDISFLIPTMGVLALGVIYAANVPIGIMIGIGGLACKFVVHLAINAFVKTEEDNDSEYDRNINRYPLAATLKAPFLEEIFFRGCMQPLLTRCIVYLAPAAAAAFLGTGFSIATTVSIVATAAIFGFIHIFNEHKNSHIQAFSATIGGVILGVTAVQFGLAAAIAAHIVNNTILVTLKRLHQG